MLGGEPWLDPRVRPHVAALADAGGLAVEGRRPVGLPWQEPDPEWGTASSGRSQLHVEVDTVGRTGDRRGDFDAVYGDWEALRELGAARGAPERVDGDVLAALRAAEADPAGLTDAHALALFHADGPAMDALAALADAVRADTVGDAVTFVVNRNINFTNVCYTGCRFCAFAQRRTDADAYTLSLAEVADRAEAAWRAGATEVCMQGGIDPELPGTAYFELARAVRERVPGMHVHAFSPMEVVNGATRSGLSVREWLTEAKASGVGSIPGTAAEILDDEVRWVLTKGKLPTEAWVEVITTAHQVGLRSSATMMYGHVDTPGHWLAHLRLLARIQDETGGFTEFVPLPFVHTKRAGLPGRGVPARPDDAGEPGRARDGPAAAARAHRPRADLVGEAGHGRGPGHAARRRRRPRRHPHGGDHQPDGRLRARLPAHRRRAGAARPRHRPAAPPAHHHLRPGGPRAGRGGPPQRRRPRRPVPHSAPACRSRVTRFRLTKWERRACNSTHVIRPPQGGRGRGSRGACR